MAPKLEACDGLVIASPVYYASANGTLISFLDRLFYSTHFSKAMKVGASVVVARRGGLSSTFDELNKYFTDAGAHPGPEHDLPDEEHRPGQRDLRPARDRAGPAHQLHPLTLSFPARPARAGFFLP